MKNLTAKMMVAAAALVVVGGVASAQVMKAEIPYSRQVFGVFGNADAVEAAMRSARKPSAEEGK